MSMQLNQKYFAHSRRDPYLVDTRRDYRRKTRKITDKSFQYNSLLAGGIIVAHVTPSS
jgi:hypothetical protein